MRKAKWVVRIVLFVCTVWVSVMGYRQVLLAHSDEALDLSTWLPKNEIVRLMRYHGADGMKITQDEVYIFRGDKWVLVLKRAQG
jgi:hypothetical protein